MRRMTVILVAVLLGFTASTCALPVSSQNDSVYDLLLEWGTYGTLDGQFSDPTSIALDSSGNVYVTDGCRIQKFTSAGVFITKWGSYGGGDGQFCGGYAVYGPEGIAVDSAGYVYIADTGDNRIQKFDTNGNFITKWGGPNPGSGDGQFGFPNGVAVDSSGYVYVLDGYYRVQKFDSNGNFVLKWGSWGAGDGQFQWPSDLAIGSDDYVYVADEPFDVYSQRNHARIQKFNLSGDLVAKWFIGDFSGVTGIAVGPTGNVYVVRGEKVPASPPWDAVEEFTSTGVLVERFYSGEPRGQDSTHTRDIAVDSTGNVYAVLAVFDTLYDRVRKYGLVLKQHPNAPTNPISASSRDFPQAGFSWTFSDADPGDRQTAWQIQVSTGSDGTGTLIWDSEKQYAESSLNVPAVYYDGPFRFSEGVTYHWRVKTWDSYDLEGPYCADQTFMIGSPTTTTAYSSSTATTTVVTTVTIHTTQTQTLTTSTATTATTTVVSPTTTATQTSTVISSTTSTTATGTTTMSAIRGTIYWYNTYGNLHPLSWVQVTAISQEGVTIVTSSNVDGTYLMYVAPGTYNVTASSDPRYLPESRMVIVPPNAVATVDLQLQSSGIPCTTCSVTTTQSQRTTTTVTQTVVTTPTVAGLQMQVISNSSVSGLIFDSTKGLLNFTVSGPTGSYGFFDATIAKSLLFGQPIVMIDGVEHPASVSEDADFWYIHVTYSHSEHHITIGGSNTIPEFPSFLLSAAVFMIVMVIFRRKSE